jgi:hypothetical protein
VAAAVVPRRTRSIGEFCALAAAVTIALQLPSTHWFYYYVVWFLPYLFVAVLAPAGETPAQEQGTSMRAPARGAENAETTAELTVA